MKHLMIAFVLITGFIAFVLFGAFLVVKLMLWLKLPNDVLIMAAISAVALATIFAVAYATNINP